MTIPAPHFLLFSEAANVSPGWGRAPQWHFCLESPEGHKLIEAMDEEPEHDSERLELLAAVRGLEALDEPSRVTLITPSRYVHRGLRYGLREWRDNQWRWERFGNMVPVRDRDLWERLDRALRIHEVRCRVWNAFPVAHPMDAGPHAGSVARTSISFSQASSASHTGTLRLAVRRTGRPQRSWRVAVRAAVLRLFGRRSLTEGLAG